jgi:uncharacterized phage protein (TIGR01671 family)
MSRVLKFRAWDGLTREMWYFALDDKERNVPWLAANCELMQFTGLTDKNGKDVFEGDVVSLDGNMTADDSLGFLPNGWTFSEEDKYVVVWDDKLAGWVLKMDTEPDSAYNAKYMNHARGLLLQGSVEIIGNIYENSDLLV